jgi:hypothetical protein
LWLIGRIAPCEASGARLPGYGFDRAMSIDRRRLSIDTIRVLAVVALKRASAAHADTTAALAPLACTICRNRLPSRTRCT